MIEAREGFPEQGRALSSVPEVRCSACRHSVSFRAYVEVVECSQVGKMKNADMLRNCFAFEVK